MQSRIILEIGLGEKHSRLVEVVQHDAEPQCTEHEQKVEDGVLTLAHFVDQREGGVGVVVRPRHRGRVGVRMIPEDAVGCRI